MKYDRHESAPTSTWFADLITIACWAGVALAAILILWPILRGQIAPSSAAPALPVPTAAPWPTAAPPAQPTSRPQAAPAQSAPQAAPVVSAPAPAAPAAPALDPAADGYGAGNAETINGGTWDGTLLPSGAEQAPPDWIVGAPGTFPAPESASPPFVEGAQPPVGTEFSAGCDGPNPPLVCAP